jgi:predicted porin
LVDASVKNVDDFGGRRRIAQDSGDQQGPRLGSQGREDLGDGAQALVVLESGVSFDTGSFAQGGLAFGRQAYVGLSSRYGAITLGRQYDFTVALGASHGVQQGTGTLDSDVTHPNNRAPNRTASLQSGVMWPDKPHRVGGGIREPSSIQN